MMSLGKPGPEFKSALGSPHLLSPLDCAAFVGTRVCLGGRRGWEHGLSPLQFVQAKSLGIWGEGSGKGLNGTAGWGQAEKMSSKNARRWIHAFSHSLIWPNVS